MIKYDENIIQFQCYIIISLIFSMFIIEFIFYIYDFMDENDITVLFLCYTDKNQVKEQYFFVIIKFRIKKWC